MSLQFRKATRDDLPALVRLLADDVLGAKRERYETPLPETYELLCDVREWSKTAPWALVGCLYVLEGSRLGSLMLADMYIMLVASETISDLRIFN